MSYIILNPLACLRSQVPFFPSLLAPAVCKPISFVYIFRAFRPLQSCGGFEMLLCADNSRTRLQVVKYGSCNTDELRCLGIGRVYIRPIQVDITLGDIIQQVATVTDRTVKLDPELYNYVQQRALRCPH